MKIIDFASNSLWQMINAEVKEIGEVLEGKLVYTI